MFAKLKAALAFKKLYSHLTNPKQKADLTMKLKPGFTTSEFWTLIATNLVLVLMAGLKMLDGELAVLLTALVTAVYTFVRNGFKLRLGLSLRPGIATSELWAVLTTGTFDLVLAALDKVDTTWAALATAAISAVYQLARTSIKAMQVNASAKG